MLGRYAVTVDLDRVQEGVSARASCCRAATPSVTTSTLQVGALTETVEVKAASGLSDTRPDVSHTVNEKYYRDLPIVTGRRRAAGRIGAADAARLPADEAERRPDVPRQPVQLAHQRRPDAWPPRTSSTAPRSATPVGHQQSHESTPPVEAVQEVKVITTSYSAQYGHTSGGFIEYTAKSGTNAFHGSGYGYFADDAFNAKGFFARRQDAAEQQQLRRSPLGGPVVIPKLYDGHNKTFFFTNFDYTRLRSRRAPRLRQHDADRRVQERRLQRAAHGEPDRRRRARAADLCGGQIFNPSTTRLVNGVPVRDPYPGNVIPANDPLRSAVAAQIAPLMVQPDRPGTAFNVAGNPAGDQTWELNARNILFRVDHSFSPNFRMSHSFYWNRRPVDPQLRRRRRLHDGVHRRDRAREEHRPTSATGSTSGSPRTMRTSSSTGSSATTC